MPKEWILNSATNRFQLNFKRNVGAVSAEIRKCSPNDIEKWKQFYFSNVKSEEHLRALGKRLYIKISEVITSEVDEITEEDCIEYIYNLVIHRTFDGYDTEIKTIYGQLEKILDMKIHPASDEWDRLFNVDFYIQIDKYYIGLQIKPTNGTEHIMQIHQEKSYQQATHKKFTKKFGGKVFYIYSVKDGKNKVIANPDVIEEIKKEIKKLQPK